jgi:hypothetical protein
MGFARHNFHAQDSFLVLTLRHLTLGDLHAGCDIFLAYFFFGERSMDDTLHLFIAPTHAQQSCLYGDELLFAPSKSSNHLKLFLSTAGNASARKRAPVQQTRHGDSVFTSTAPHNACGS